jgi:hypothetical protein
MQIILQVIFGSADAAGRSSLAGRSMSDKKRIIKGRLFKAFFCYKFRMAHTFKVGQRVTMDRSKIFSSAPGTYLIIAALPESGGRLQYRIKSELEKHERVAEQSQLHLMLEQA